MPSTWSVFFVQPLMFYYLIASGNKLVCYSIYVKGMLLMPLMLWFFFHLQFEGRKYCEHDFQMLFAPCCHQCGKFYIEVKHFTLITNGNRNITGGRCATLVYVLWEMALCGWASELPEWTRLQRIQGAAFPKGHQTVGFKKNNNLHYLSE